MFNIFVIVVGQDSVLKSQKKGTGKAKTDHLRSKFSEEEPSTV